MWGMTILVANVWFLVQHLHRCLVIYSSASAARQGECCYCSDLDKHTLCAVAQFTLQRAFTVSGLKLAGCHVALRKLDSRYVNAAMNE